MNTWGFVTVKVVVSMAFVIEMVAIDYVTTS